MAARKTNARKTNGTSKPTSRKRTTVTSTMVNAMDKIAEAMTQMAENNKPPVDYATMKLSEVIAEYGPAANPKVFERLKSELSRKGLSENTAIMVYDLETGEFDPESTEDNFWDMLEDKKGRFDDPERGSEYRSIGTFVKVGEKQVHFYRLNRFLGRKEQKRFKNVPNETRQLIIMARLDPKITDFNYPDGSGEEKAFFEELVKHPDVKYWLNKVGDSLYNKWLKTPAEKRPSLAWEDYESAGPEIPTSVFTDLIDNGRFGRR